jgi:DNA mismatch repair protein MutS2
MARKRKAQTVPDRARGYDPGRRWHEIDLHGMYGDEAMLLLAEAIDKAVRLREPGIRINHGKGTGTLRKRVHDVLSSHPLVRRYYLAPDNHGGHGVTLAELRR